MRLESEFEIGDVVKANHPFLNADEYMVTAFQYSHEKWGFLGTSANTFYYSLYPISGDGGSGGTVESNLKFIRKGTEEEQSWVSRL
jgi:hypothetical protein